MHCRCGLHMRVSVNRGDAAADIQCLRLRDAAECRCRGGLTHAGHVTTAAADSARASSGSEACPRRDVGRAVEPAHTRPRQRRRVTKPRYALRKRHRREQCNQYGQRNNSKLHSPHH